MSAPDVAEMNRTYHEDHSEENARSRKDVDPIPVVYLYRAAN